IRTTLEERLALAIQDKEFVDNKKLQKELRVQEALTNELNQMKKVVAAFEKMNRHAAKISKWQEYLIDHSHMAKCLLSDHQADQKIYLMSTWMAFGGNTRDLDSIWKETDEVTTLHEFQYQKSIHWLERAS
ncbi:hypothetical protein Tco_0744755, partial [Tanacetum coccineum]